MSVRTSVSKCLFMFERVFVCTSVSVFSSLARLMVFSRYCSPWSVSRFLTSCCKVSIPWGKFGLRVTPFAYPSYLTTKVILQEFGGDDAPCDFWCRGAGCGDPIIVVAF